ncbi:MAG: hypothetical protein Q4C91_13690 [Eubacteriales bacterium]|nr:hypothetical protein [Eubacteriales bacterium]
MSMYDVALDKKEKEIVWSKDTCDRQDYLIAVSCGALAGLVDIFFVGGAATKFNELSLLGKMSDKMFDEIVKNISRALGWTPRAGNENNMSSAIHFLENRYKVPYEHTSTKDVHGLFKMNAKDHHIKSLAHAPDPIGLFFSILDQFTNSASFVSNGKIIRIDASERGFELQGSNFISKIYCGFCNWIGHLLSDVVGSNGVRQVGSDGRGTGLPIPFMELFLMCDFGTFQIGKDRQSLAVLMTRVFSSGYDMRYSGAMAIPVILEELMIKVLWALKRHFYHKKDWSECIPTSKHADLRMMVLIGNGTLCIFDGVDAAVRAGIQGGNALIFVLHLNLVAWARLIVLVFRELRIRYGVKIDQAVSRYLAEIGLNDAYALKQYYERMNILDQKLDQMLKDFAVYAEREYRKFMEGMNRSLNPAMGTSLQRRNASIEFARNQGVDPKRIMKTPEELRYWLDGGK